MTRHLVILLLICIFLVTLVGYYVDRILTSWYSQTRCTLKTFSRIQLCTGSTNFTVNWCYSSSSSSRHSFLACCGMNHSGHLSSSPWVSDMSCVCIALGSSTQQPTCLVNDRTIRRSNLAKIHLSHSERWAKDTTTITTRILMITQQLNLASLASTRPSNSSISCTCWVKPTIWKLLATESNPSIMPIQILLPLCSHSLFLFVPVQPSAFNQQCHYNIKSSLWKSLTQRISPHERRVISDKETWAFLLHRLSTQIWGKI